MESAPLCEAAAVPTALERAIAEKGSQGLLAKAIGFSQPSVWRWLNGTPVPAEAAIAIEKTTGIRREEIRPDLFADGSAGRTDSAPEGAAAC